MTTPDDQSLQLFKNVVDDLSSANRDLKSALMQCQLACTLLDWSEPQKWFENEIGGHDYRSDEIPDFRIIYGQRIWRTKVSSMNDRIDRVTEDMVGIGPDPQEEPCNIRIWHGIDHLISFAMKGTVDPTGETKASERIGRASSSKVVERVQVFDARSYQSVLNAIQTLTFNFASESYASLLKNKSVPSGIPQEETPEPSQIPEPTSGSQTTVNIDTVIGSPFQFGSGSQRVEYSSEDRGELIALMSKLIDTLPGIPLSEDYQEEAIAEISTIQAQLKSSRPKTGIITESLQTLRNVLLSAAGNALAMGLAAQIGGFL